MKLRKVNIQNYKSIKDETVLVPNLLALVGPNCVGKSNILNAINLVLGRKSYPTYTTIIPEDYFQKDTSKPIKITLSFSELTDEERKYFRAKTRGYMRIKGGLPVRANYSENLNICLELPYESQPKFYFVGDDYEAIRYGNDQQGREIGVGKSDREFLPHLILIPGLRDASRYFSDSTKYDWGKVIDSLRVQINKDQDIRQSLSDLNTKVSSCKDVQELSSKVKEYLLEFLTDEYKVSDVSLLPIDPGDLFKVVKLVIDDGFVSALENKGDGIKSLAVIALLLMISKQETNVIIGLEEPELFLHPSALYVLNGAMQARSLQSQVIYSSHSPFLINVTRPKNIARVYKLQGETKVVQLPFFSYWITPKGELEVERDIDAQRNLLFFARAVILVEGPTEFLCLPTFANKIGVDLAKKGIILVEVNGKPNLKNYSNYLNDFKIPHIIVYDMDEINAPLNSIIESLGVSTFPLDFDFEDMLAKDIGNEKTNELLQTAYGETYQKYKQDYRIRGLEEGEKISKFLQASKPFAARHIAEIVSAETMPKTIKDIINKAVLLIE